MLNRPKFSFYLYSTGKPIPKDSNIWSKPLSAGRNKSLKSRKDQKVRRVSHRDYFRATRSFLENNDFKIIGQAMTACLKREVAPDELKEIRICLAKHGEFYHPAQIEIILKEEILPFGLNVAVTPSGISCLETEYPLLRRLNNDFSFSFIPTVYGRGDVVIENKAEKISMFLGEWFEGFDEFHISRDPDDKTNKIRVWDSETGGFFLTPDQVKTVYTQAAMILTCYFNIHTFEQIFSWHHAAGDFVLRRQEDTIDVRLITVRKYLPLFYNQVSDESMLLNALLLFFLNLSVRMRLDRVDGVGEIVWSDDAAVAGTVKGFFIGLSRIMQSRSHRGTLSVDFKKHLMNFTAKDLLYLLRGIVDNYHLHSPDVPVVKKHLKKHAEVLHRAIFSPHINV